MSNQHTSVSIGSAFGFPLLLITITFLASIGAFGQSCQSCTQSGIRSTAAAVRGEP